MTMAEECHKTSAVLALDTDYLHLQRREPQSDCQDDYEFKLNTTRTCEYPMLKGCPRSRFYQCFGSR